MNTGTIQTYESRRCRRIWQGYALAGAHSMHVQRGVSSSKRAKRMKNTDDWDWADVLESLQEDCEKEHLTDMDLFVAWKIGLAAFLKMRQLGLVTQKEDD